MASFILTLRKLYLVAAAVVVRWSMIVFFMVGLVYYSDRFGDTADWVLSLGILCNLILIVIATHLSYKYLYRQVW